MTAGRMLTALGYSERLRHQKGLRWGSDRAAFEVAPALMREAAALVDWALDTQSAPANFVGRKPEAARIAWRIMRAAIRASIHHPTDRLEWRGRCHHTNGRFEQVSWPGGQSTRHTVPLRERARCLLMGRDYPIAGPTGRLP